MRQIAYTASICLLLLIFSCQKEDGFTTTVQPAVQQTRVQLVSETFEGKSLLMVAESRLGLYTAFIAGDHPGDGLVFRAVQDSLPIILTDRNGNYYDVWGTVQHGPDKGAQLPPAQGMMAYWFAWGAFYPGCSLYEHADIQAPEPPPGDWNWQIPYALFAQGALPGAIPSIDQPIYLDREIEYPEYLVDSTLCLVVKIGGEVLVYPHPVLQWHEVVNETRGGVSFSVLYCPLTGSGCVWNREVQGQTMELEVSGLLYNGNLIAKDRVSGSHWSQMLHDAVQGPFSGARAESIQTLELPLESVRRLFRSFKMLSDQTGYDWEYGNFPCGDYCTNHDRMFYSIFFDDPRAQRKDRTYGVMVNGKARVFHPKSFEN